MSEKNRVFYKIASREEELEAVERIDGAGSVYTFEIDNGSGAGQEVLHLSTHVMDGRKMGRP